MDTVSVIIPVKNRAALLRKTLANLVRQTHAPHEIIVVDDGSTDELPQVIGEFAPQHVRCIPNQGKGPGAARNTGLAAASGQYIKYFDSDDLMTINTLETQLAVLKATGAGMVYSPYIYAREVEDNVWKQEDVIIQYQAIPAGKSLRQCMVRGFFTVIPGMLFSRAFLLSMGPWRTDMTAYEDWDLLWRMGGRYAQPPHTNACAMLYRLHGTQTTGANLNDEARDKMRFACFMDALAVAQFENNPGPSDRLLLSAQIYNTAQQLAHLPEYADIASQQPAAVKMAWGYLRAENKLGRLLTRSNWQVFHGINADEAAWQHYLKMIV